jgi:phage-related protein
MRHAEALAQKNSYKKLFTNKIQDSSIVITLLQKRTEKSISPHLTK